MAPSLQESFMPDETSTAQTYAPAQPEADTAARSEAAPPIDAVDAQSQAFVEHSVELAEKAAVYARERAERAQKFHEEQASRPRPEAAQDVPPPSSVLQQSGPRHVAMVTTEEDRLARHKTMVADHLRNAEPDMTGGGAIGDEETPRVPPATETPA
jgi:hypothetical protein